MKLRDPQDGKKIMNVGDLFFRIVNEESVIPEDKLALRHFVIILLEYIYY